MQIIHVYPNTKVMFELPVNFEVAIDKEFNRVSIKACKEDEMGLNCDYYSRLKIIVTEHFFEFIFIQSTCQLFITLFLERNIAVLVLCQRKL